MTETAAKYTVVSDPAKEQSIDIIINNIAIAYINDIGTEAAWEQLQTLLSAQDRVANGRSWKAMEWIGAHLVSILNNETFAGMVACGMCPFCAAELVYRSEEGSVWVECPKCRTNVGEVI